VNPSSAILSKSLVNCHCKGMDSLLIKEGPGMVRMFIARPEHELWRNNPGTFGVTFSIALHRHRTDVTLMPVLGELYNVEAAMGQSDPLVSTVPMQSFSYASPILEKDGRGGFAPLDRAYLPLRLRARRLLEPTHLAALHSVYVPKGKPAAWFIFEGEPNREYNSIVYSNDFSLDKLDLSQYDQPMTSDRLREDLELIGVRC